jgi:hypothetical protein
MILGKQLNNRVLFFFGAAALALRSGLQVLIDRSGHTTDTTDFLLGVLMGVGIELPGLVA